MSAVEICVECDIADCHHIRARRASAASQPAAPRLDGDCLAERAIRDALAAFPDGWESAFVEARETEWGGVVAIGHPWEDEGLAEVITVDTENFSDSPAAMKIASFIVAANPKSIAALLAELDSLRAALSASKQGGKAEASLSHSQIVDIGARNSSPEQFGRLFTEAQWFAAVRQIEAALQPQGEKP